MPDEQLTPEEADLRQARAAAHECEAAAGQLAQFADRVSPVVTPADITEYDTLVAREDAAAARRAEAFARLGLHVRSIDTPE